MSIISDLFKKGERLVSNNSTAILTGVGVTGTITTAILTGQASFKAARILDSEDYTTPVDDENHDDSNIPNKRTPSTTDKIKLVWVQYIPAIGVGSLTITSIILANRIGSRQAAALAAAYGLSERAFHEYKEKVVEKLGENKEMGIRDEIAQDRVKATPINSREIILAGTGEVLCFDMLTGRYFQSTVEEIKKAENKVNFEIVNHMYASLSSFYDEIGLPATEISDTLGWNLNNRCDVKFSTVMSTDNRPCVAIDFHILPVVGYGQLY